MPTLFLALLTTFLVAVVAFDLLWNPRLIARTQAALAEGSTTARTRLCRIVIASAWVKALIGFALLVGAGISLDDIGLQLGDRILNALPYVIVIPAGLFFAARGARKRGVEPRLTGGAELFIPHTKAEQRWLAATAITLGVTEEIIYRAAPVLLFLGFFPTQDPGLGTLFATLLLCMAHLYQGVNGVIVAAVIGAIAGSLYIHTGALWPGMLLHALMDLRLLLLFPLKDNVATREPPISPL